MKSCFSKTTDKENLKKNHLQGQIRLLVFFPLVANINQYNAQKRKITTLQNDTL
jgi:hypothetical protein